MKAEISNLGVPGGPRVSGVYLQQGRMITDRDWNALCDALSARLAEVASTTLDAGAPRRGGLLTGFVEAAGAWRAEFRQSGGFVAAEGRIGTPAPLNPETEFTWLNQRDLPSLAAEEAGRPDFLYTDVWDQPLTAFALPELLDVALHGADTAFVTRRVAQIKAATKEMLEETECGLRLKESAAPRIGAALAFAELREAESGDDRCDPCAITVEAETRVRNHLWRLEVHSVRQAEDGLVEQVMLKWSEDNGAVQRKRPAEFDAATFEAGYAYEFFNAQTELHLGLPPLGWGSRPDRGDLRHKDFDEPDARYDRLRQWDGWCLVDLVDDDVVDGWDRGKDLSSAIASGHGRAVCESGVVTLELERLTVTLSFADSDGAPRPVLSGDHWLALSRDRAAEGSQVRMLSATPASLTALTPPFGLSHGYCLLGEPNEAVTGVQGLSPSDKRRLSHPSLTCLRAEDVGYDPADCAFADERGAYSVQDALDAFCERLQAPYIVLKPSSGAGQEGPANAFLTCPAAVVAEDQDGKPAKGVRVTFEVPRNGDDRVATAPTGGAPTDREVTVTTDEHGLAFCWWWLGPAGGGFPGFPGVGPRPGEIERAPETACRMLRASLADAPPQGAATDVRFTARLEQKGPGGGPVEAEDVRFDPECDYLRRLEVDDVAEALEALCAALPRLQALPKIAGVSWENDRVLQSEAFAGGLQIRFDRAMRFALFSDDVVIVTVEDFGGEDERNGVVYSRPLILHCAFSEGGRDTLSVKPIIPDFAGSASGSLQAPPGSRSASWLPACVCACACLVARPLTRRMRSSTDSCPARRAPMAPST
jgi:hypothetical protein